MGQLPMHTVVPRLLGTPGSIRTPAPTLGQHNHALLAEIGVTGKDYKTLIKSGIVGGEPKA
jgi:crotonobetainyl-CoA:carnitine CoA-transferase CaiB-like acyl-CoA transferase